MTSEEIIDEANHKRTKRTYDANGNVVSEITIDEEQGISDEKKYKENGTLEEEKIRRHNKEKPWLEESEFKIFDEAGKIKSRETYRETDIHEYQAESFDKDGNLTRKIEKNRDKHIETYYEDNGRRETRITSSIIRDEKGNEKKILPSWQVSYKDGKLDGKETIYEIYYDPIEKEFYSYAAQTTEYSQGKKNGEEVKYKRPKGYESPELISSISYKDDVKHGPFYQKDGQQEVSGNYVDGKPDGEWQEHNPAGSAKISNFKAGVLDGDYSEYILGTSILGQFKQGKKEGTWQTYGEKDGKPILQKETNYKDGQKNGITTTYHENGQVESKVNFKNDKREGQAQEFDKNGNLIMEGEFKNDKPEGIWKQYHTNGQLQSEVMYHDGQIADGSYKVFDKEGKCIGQKTVKDGKEGLIEIFDENGQKLAQGYKKGEKGFSGISYDSDKKQEERKAKEEIQFETGYSADALSGVGKKVLDLKDNIERKNTEEAIKTVQNGGNSADNGVKDLLSKMADSKVADKIVKAGLGSEHLATGADALTTEAKTLQGVMESSETTKASLLEKVNNEQQAPTPIIPGQEKEALAQYRNATISADTPAPAPIIPGQTSSISPIQQNIQAPAPQLPPKNFQISKPIAPKAVDDTLMKQAAVSKLGR